MTISASIVLPERNASLTISGAFESADAASVAIESLLVGGLAVHAVRIAPSGKDRLGVWTKPGVCSFGITLVDEPAAAKAPIWLVETDAKDAIGFLRRLFDEGAADAVVSITDTEAEPVILPTVTP